MQLAQQQQFYERMHRIASGGENTFGTVYTGHQDIETPKGKKVSGVKRLKTAAEMATPSATQLMRQGLRLGVMHAGFALCCFGAYLYFVAA